MRIRLRGDGERESGGQYVEARQIIVCFIQHLIYYLYILSLPPAL